MGRTERTRGLSRYINHFRTIFGSCISSSGHLVALKQSLSKQRAFYFTFTSGFRIGHLQTLHDFAIVALPYVTNECVSFTYDEVTLTTIKNVIYCRTPKQGWIEGHLAGLDIHKTTQP